MKGGRSLSWESLAIDTAGNNHDVVFNNLAFTAGGSDVRYRVLIPPNVTRGVVTLERTRLIWETFFEGGAVALSDGISRFRVPWNMQLAAVRDGAIQDASVLDPRNAADQENNAIIARGIRIGDGATNDGFALAVDRYYQTKDGHDIDVKSKRRFDRALWALILVASSPAALTADWKHILDVRALFMAPDGV